MNINKHITPFVIGAIISMMICTAFQGKSDIAKQLVGEWRNQYVKIGIASHTPGGKPMVMEADTSNWEARIGIKPIRTYFKADGSYYSEYRDLKDSIVRRPAGTWAIIKGDTLVMTQVKPQSSVLKLHISIVKNLATFHGLIDFDGDGKDNDEYYGVQKKFN